MDDQFVAGPANDGALAVLQVVSGSTVKHTFSLDAAELDDLILRLSDARRRLLEEVPSALDPRWTVSAIPAPQWEARPIDQPKGRLLVLRHPGLGWVAFAFPETEAKKLAEALA